MLKRVLLGAATAMLMALATTGTSVSAAETSNDSSAGRAASGLGSQLVPVRFTSEEYRLRGEVCWHRGDQQPAVAVTPGDRAFARVRVDSRGDAGRSLEFSVEHQPGQFQYQVCTNPDRSRELVSGSGLCFLV